MKEGQPGRARRFRVRDAVFARGGSLLTWLLLAGAGLSATQPQAPAYRLEGINFSPFVDGQDPNRGARVSEAQLRARMAIVAPYCKGIRTFGATNGLEAAPRIAQEFGLRVAMGAWIGRSLAANEAELANLIAAARAGLVDLAIVGSEVLLRRDLSEEELIGYLRRARQQIPPGVPVSTAEAYGEWLARPALVQAVDAILVNYYPYWEGYSAGAAIGVVHAQHQRVLTSARGKPVIVSETGWPSAGNVIRNAVPSLANAVNYFLGFVSWARANKVPYFYFEAFDETWKAAYEGPQGAHWGLWDKYGRLKPGMQRVFSGETVPDTWSGTEAVGGPGSPAIEFTYVPPYGSFDDLQGRVRHVPPAESAVAVYIFAPWPEGGGWWTKPTWDRPLTPVWSDGSWSTDITTGGVDDRASRIAAFLLPKGYDPPILAGERTLPGSLQTMSLSRTEVTRTPQSISGTITTHRGIPLAGVTVRLSGTGSAATETFLNGKYSFFNLPSTGTYTVTPARQGYVFLPATRRVDALQGAHSADFLAVPEPVLDGVVNAASFVTGMVPGSLATVFGRELSAVRGTVSAGGARIWEGAWVEVEGQRAPLLGLCGDEGYEQINFQVPFELGSPARVRVEVYNQGARGVLADVPLYRVQPGLFEWAAPDGVRYAAAVKQDGSLVGPGNPASAGEAIALFLTGLGPILPVLRTGEPGPDFPPAETWLKPTVRVGDAVAPVLFSGYAPRFIGLYQVNIVVPGGLAPGPARLEVAVEGVASRPSLILLK